MLTLDAWLRLALLDLGALVAVNVVFGAIGELQSSAAAAATAEAGPGKRQVLRREALLRKAFVWWNVALHRGTTVVQPIVAALACAFQAGTIRLFPSNAFSTIPVPKNIISWK
jgi:hypothetical protein